MSDNPKVKYHIDVSKPTFRPEDLIRILANKKISAPGWDGITYDLYKNCESLHQSDNKSLPLIRFSTTLFWIRKARINLQGQ